MKDLDPYDPFKSHPARGAWIEMMGRDIKVLLKGRTPHGVRGLK